MIAEMTEQRRDEGPFRGIGAGLDVQLETARAHLADMPREAKDAIERGLDPGPVGKGYGSGSGAEMNAEDASACDLREGVREAAAENALVDAGGKRVQGDDALAGGRRPRLHDAPDDGLGQAAGDLGFGFKDLAQLLRRDAEKNALGRHGDGREIRLVLHDLPVAESIAGAVDGGDQMPAGIEVAGFAPAADDEIHRRAGLIL